jgi:hypothetical protein
MPASPLENTPTDPGRGNPPEGAGSVLRGEIADSLLHQGAVCLLLITVVLVGSEAQHSSHSIWGTLHGHQAEKKDCR